MAHPSLAIRRPVGIAYTLPAMPVKLAVIVNPSAGGGRAEKVLKQAQELLTDRGVDFTVEPTRDLPHARELAIAAASDGRIAVAIGGDGLVGAVASATADSQGLMAIVPGGRGNDLARVLNIPTDVSEAIEITLNGRDATMDLGEANGKTFCCIASLGFDSDANRIANETKVPGALAYLWAAIRALAAWKTARFTLELDGEEHSFEGFSVIAANSKAYGGGMFIAPDADIHDGQLDVVTIAERSRLRFLALLPTVFKGTHVKTRQVTVRRGRILKISADRDFTVFADGDPLCDLPATVSVRQDAVRIMLPTTT
jgi:YegS/Rv2252/BmrU family lipid kinase